MNLREPRPPGSLARRRRLDQATAHRELSWFGRAAAALAEVGRPDLVDYLQAGVGPDPRVKGGCYPLVRVESCRLPLEDRLVLSKAVDLALTGWPNHPSHPPWTP